MLFQYVDQTFDENLFAVENHHDCLIFDATLFISVNTYEKGKQLSHLNQFQQTVLFQQRSSS